MHETATLHVSQLGLTQISVLLGEVIGYIGIVVMMYGAMRGFYLFIQQVLLRRDIKANIRIVLGQHLALGLEFLVGKDIIESLVHPTWDDLGKLCAIIVIRSVLTLFLERELKEVAREEREARQMKKDDAKHRA